MTVKMTRIRRRVQCLMQIVCFTSALMLVVVFTVTKDRDSGLTATRCRDLLSAGQPIIDLKARHMSNGGAAKSKPNSITEKPIPKALPKYNLKPKFNYDSLLKGTSKVSEEYRQYLQLRSEKVDQEEISFIVSGETICPRNSAVFLLVLCVSEHYNVDGRKALRETWATVVGTQTWPLRRDRFSVKLAFVLANPGTSIVQQAVVEEEIQKFQDIVLVDVKEDVQSQSKRFMAGLKWTSEYCNQAKFVLRVDENVFVHIPNLVDYLKPFKLPSRGLLIGYVYTNQRPLRGGKLLINQTAYPFDLFPPYLSQPTYVISGNVISRLLSAAERLPYVFKENIFITGIVREAIGAEIKHKPEIAPHTDKASKMCDLHKKGQISLANVKNSIKFHMWEALHSPNCTEGT